MPELEGAEKLFVEENVDSLILRRFARMHADNGTAQTRRNSESFAHVHDAIEQLVVGLRVGH